MSKNRKLPKHISIDKRNGRYQLTKRINGKHIYIGSSMVIEVIKDLKQQCLDVGWDYDEVIKIKEKFLFERPRLENKYNSKRVSNERYISQHKYGNTIRYMIQKTIDGKTVYFGSYQSLKQAIQIRDLLIKYRWNRSKIDIRKYTSGSARNKLSNKNEYHRNVYYNPDTDMWEVRRIVNYKLEVFAISDSLQKACEYRDQLEKRGWRKTV